MIEATEIYTVRGVGLSAEVSLLKCQSCGEKCNADQHEDVLNQVYRKYRRLREWIQPECLRKYLSDFSIRREVVAQKLGWEPDRVKMFENGCLQTEEEEQDLRRLLCEESHDNTT